MRERRTSAKAGDNLAVGWVGEIWKVTNQRHVEAHHRSVSSAVVAGLPFDAIASSRVPL
jgi:hypothetical protein